MHVNVFFYGSYMNRDVLAEVDLHPEELRTARLSGYDITISPLANLVRSDRHLVYGVVAAATHAELKRLYQHAEQVLGGRYLPVPVVVELLDGAHLPCLCYISSDLEPAPAEPSYVDRVAGAARRCGLPDWYIQRLESYRV